MLHLTTDRLAALADEQPNQIEAAHLAACPVCAREREAYVQLAGMARQSAAEPGRPLSSWEGIEAALRTGETAAAVVRRPPASGLRLVSRAREALSLGGRVPRAARQLLAASVLLAVGGVAGRLSAGAPVPLVSADREASVPRVAVSVQTSDDELTEFRTPSEALTAMAQAERQYQVAATFLAGHEPSADPGEEPEVDSSAVYRARLAALDEVMAATRAALYTAPFDPVINRYYLATVGAREVTVRQLGTALPEGQSVSRF